MTEPRTLGRVDWMPRKKVWRVIWYKGAADIPAGDYPTKKEAEDALRELVANGNPGEAVAPEVTRISPTYENLVEGNTLIDQAGDRWLITGIKKEGVPGRWAYTIKGETIDLTRTRPLGEIERYYKIEQPAIPKTETGNPGFTAKEAKSIGDKLGIDFKRYDVEQFRQGLNVELEHCNVTNCDPLLTGKIAQAHLNELPDYYTRLAKMELIQGNPGDERLLKVAIEREPLRVAKQLAYEVHRLSPTDIVDKEDYARGYRYRLSKADPSQPYPQIVMARNEGEVATFLKKQVGGNPMPKTERERIRFHERIFGKGAIPPLERLRRGQTANELMPMPPEEGPPLPKMFALRWPWKK